MPNTAPDQTALGKPPINAALASARNGFIVVGVFSFFLNLLYLVSPLYMLQVYDRVLASGSHDTLFYLTLIAVVALVVFGALEGLRTSVLARLGAWINNEVSSKILRSSLFAAIANGGGQADALRDIQQVQGFVGGSSINPFFDAPWAPIFIFMIWALHPWLGVLSVATAVVLFLIALLNENLTRKPLSEASGASRAARVAGDRIIRHAETVHAMGMMAALEKRWLAVNATAQDKQTGAAEIGGWLQGLSRFIRMAAQVGVLGLGALLVLEGQLSAGAMIAGSILLGRALAPVEQSIGAWKAFVSARQSRERLVELSQQFPLFEEPMELPEPEGRLSVEGLYVKPPRGDEFLLKNITFALNPGEAVAVVGPSAAGKSTLCRAIAGTFPAARGHVRLDGADVSQWPRGQFGRAVGYLPQTVELFEGTIRDNIARMQESEPEPVIRAAQLSEVHEMILKMPEGYDTRVGPNGVNLSGGQRQRLAMARAVFGNPRLIILDEPNANLDQEGEQALTRTILRLRELGATVILVAHRQSALASVNKILVLNSGAVEVFDERDAVLKIMQERRRFAQQGAAKSGGADDAN